MVTLNVFPNSDALFHFAADDFAKRAVLAVNSKGNFSVVLSGGNTPKLFFDVLADLRINIPWDKIQFFFGDERYVPSTDPNSNYYMANKHLFSKVPIKPENIYRIPTEFKDPQMAAKNYEEILRDIFRLKNMEFPSFDLVYLGLGEDSHTASLMPYSDAVKNPLSRQLVASLFVPKLNMHRITLTPMSINHGLTIIFLVTGTDKASAVEKVLEGEKDPTQYPAQLIQSIAGQTIWYLDQAAANHLPKVE